MNSIDDLRRLREERLRRIYARDPVLYADQVLGATYWEKQQEAARALAEHKRVLVKASHGVGKTHLAGGLVNWFFDTRNPSITLTTAPTKAQVEDLLFKEVRIQRRGRPGLMPRAPRIETAPNHFAAGFTAQDADSFQGRHEENVLVVFDEATGVEGPFWTATEGILTGEESYWLAILNPTDTSSQAYAEEQSGAWHVITISCLDHPNIAAELRGEPAPFPAAVRLKWLVERIERWCEEISPASRTIHDIEFPPGSGRWYRPGPEFESRVLGRWPRQGSQSVWSEEHWEASLKRQDVPLTEPLEIGCDVARSGDDFTSIVVRRGPCVLHHETHNGWKTDRTARRLKELAKEYCLPGEDPTEVAIKIDDDGVGGGVVDQTDGFNFVGVSAASNAIESERYPNRRSELWFSTAKRAAEGRLDVSRLNATSKRLIRTQLMAPRWKLDSDGRRVVEKKDDTKKRMRPPRSPDDADGLNLAFAPAKRRRWTATSRSG
ncbi:MAG: hypothetical protein ACO1SV_12325 [Fimbriimonas sp.]